MNASSDASMNRTLVIGWFSFELMGATAGDFLAKDVVCGWLREIGSEPRVAVVSALRSDEIGTDQVDPADYENVIFVCGPIGDGPPLNTFLDRFPHARKFAVNVTLLQERTEWNPFAGILERDSSVRVNPDITFASPKHKVPVIGLIYVGSQKGWSTQRHDLVERIVEKVLSEMDVAVVRIDTRLDINQYGLRSPAQVASVIERMDAVVTTRLHGSVLALQRAVPVVAIDSFSGGYKLSKQMKRIGWPLLLDVDTLTEDTFRTAFSTALTDEARKDAYNCASNAAKEMEMLKREFLDMFMAEKL